MCRALRKFHRKATLPVCSREGDNGGYTKLPRQNQSFFPVGSQVITRSKLWSRVTSYTPQRTARSAQRPLLTYIHTLLSHNACLHACKLNQGRPSMQREVYGKVPQYPVNVYHIADDNGTLTPLGMCTRQRSVTAVGGGVGVGGNKQIVYSALY